MADQVRRTACLLRPNIGIGGYLGSAYAPVFIGSADNHPAMANFQPPEIYAPLDESRFGDRRSLLAQIESSRYDRDKQVRDWSDLRARTYDAMTRTEGRQAFELHREPDAVRQRYGMHPLGQNLLLARRMVQAGVRFITVNGWAGQADYDKQGPPAAAGTCTAATWEWEMPSAMDPTAWAFAFPDLIRPSQHCSVT
jgi:hypothetical protein